MKVSTECSWSQLIRPSKDDAMTRHTKEQIVSHNENHEANCNVAR